MKLRLNLLDACMLLNPLICTSKFEEKKNCSVGKILEKYNLSKKDLKKLKAACQRGEFEILPANTNSIQACRNLWLTKADKGDIMEGED